jgi:hypothetical protein
MYKLRQEAKRKEIVSTLTTQIAKQHTDWYVNSSLPSFISVRKSMIMKLLDEIRDDEKIKEEIAREVAEDSNDLLLKKQYNVDIESALDFIESWIKESGYPYIHDISGIEQNIHHFLLCYLDLLLFCRCFSSFIYLFLYSLIVPGKRELFFLLVP